MKSFAVLVSFAATALACSGTEHRIGGSSAPIGAGGGDTGGTGTGGSGTGGSGTSGSSGSGQGGSVATGGVGGTGVGGSSTTGGAGGTVGSTGGGPATGGSSGTGAGGSSTGECAQDSDCRLFAFYCTGCDCLVLAPGEAEPTCSGPGVECFADACLNRSAVCYQGSCQVKEDNCPVGQTQRNICVECGTAGGCSRTADTCTKTCTSNADCTGVTYSACFDGLCQMGGCI